MSTPSIVAAPVPGGWRGRYVHNDGYPSYMLPILNGLIKRDGVDKVVETLIVDHPGWSMIAPQRPLTIAGRDDYASLTVFASGLGTRGTAVEHYGVAYTAEQGMTKLIKNTDDDTACAYWAYLLDYDGTIKVLRRDADAWRPATEEEIENGDNE